MHHVIRRTHRVKELLLYVLLTVPDCGQKAQFTMLKTVLMSSVAFSIAFAAQGANADRISFVDIAPANSMMVVAVDDMEGMIRQLKATPLSGLYEIDSFKEMMSDQYSGMMEGLQESMDEMGVEDTEGMTPDAMGFSLYVDLDEETGQAKSFIMGYADFGKNSKSVQALLTNALDAQRENGLSEIDTTDIRGREVMVVTQIVEPEDDMDDDFGGMGDMMMFGDPSTLFPDLTKLYYVWDDSRMLMANDVLAIDEALGVFDGDKGDCVADEDDFQAIVEMLGDVDGMMVMRFAPLGELMAPMMMGPAGMVEPVIDEFFGSMKGMGFSVNIADDASAPGMLEARGVVYAPGEKSGILSLMTTSTMVDNTPPKMVPADVIAYSRMNIDFKKIIPMVREMSAAIPMGGQEIDSALDMYEPSIKPALDTLGPAMYNFSSVRRPIAADSSSTVMMIKANDSDRVHPLLATVGPSMGMEPRDFKGETIWSDDMQSMSMAVAGPWMMMGNSRGVEQSIRSMDAKGESLGENPDFKAAIAPLANTEAVGWGWLDPVQQYEVQQQSMKAMLEGMGGFDEFAIDPADQEMFQDAIGDSLFELSPEEMARCVGPMIWSLTTSDSGWTQKIWLLPPAGKAG